MQELSALITPVAPYVRNILITGETGSGKELVAHALHRVGPRRGAPLETLNCAAVVDTLFASEMFGHVRGAFTGAVASKPGILEVANGGTLFLDEVAELSPAGQAKLLRVIQTREVTRVGATRGRRVDVAIIAATNRDLTAEVAEGRFRADLFYRLSVLEVRVPPLRCRSSDIPLLMEAFVEEFSREYGREPLRITQAAREKAMAYDWPGNVRELRNAIYRACMLSDGPVSADDLSLVGERDIRGRSFPAATQRRGRMPDDDEIVRALGECGDNRVAAARSLGTARRTLYRRLARLRPQSSASPGSASSSAAVRLALPGAR